MADDLHELSALYALDALDGEDRARFEEHLDDCERCRGELAGLQGAAGALAFAVAGPAPPAELRSRIVDAARAEGQNVVPLRPRRSLALSVAAAVAVAATAAAVAFGLWAASLDHTLSGERTAVSILGDPQARHIPLSGKAALAADLPAPPHGKVYEAWVINANVAQRAGTFTGNRVTLTTRVPAGATVAVTLEHAGGVDKPTTEPLLSATA
jgi:anti-sigma factor RsiW